MGNRYVHDTASGAVCECESCKPASKLQAPSSFTEWMTLNAVSKGVTSRPPIGGPTACLSNRSTYLESKGNTVPEGIKAQPPSATDNPTPPKPKPEKPPRVPAAIDSGIELIGAKCRCRFCPKCCIRLGIALKDRLNRGLVHFGSLLMITLTVDPKLYPNPEACLRDVRDRRCVAKLVKKLHELGHLRSRRWAFVLEFQRNTEMPHWHLLVEADFIPFDDLKSVWNAFRPKGAPPVEGNAPGFGTCRISKSHFSGPSHAANYVTKYLTKMPANGWPEWVLDFKGQIRLFSTSRDFFTASEGTKPTRENKPKQQEPKRQCRTVRERTGSCGDEATLMQRVRVVDESGNVTERRLFLGTLTMSMDEAKTALLYPLGEGSTISLARAEVLSLTEYARRLDVPRARKIEKHCHKIMGYARPSVDEEGGDQWHEEAYFESGHSGLKMMLARA
jgi:hypothetical protein